VQAVGRLALRAAGLFGHLVARLPEQVAGLRAGLARHLCSLVGRGLCDALARRACLLARNARHRLVADACRCGGSACVLGHVPQLPLTIHEHS